ncbi:hypothetical protein [Algoriphagus pacificus]|uniref:Uncharacterized protein n=1 Tax=Algoriphagus pacificus TaxID=2811234 RepID=A0ABS3CEX3_9BACT|nr:hypothetical protein [Algoriphagus pacificus]MBN7815355.1 hypothetical protein [Algoriphagus pacificus]
MKNSFLLLLFFLASFSISLAQSNADKSEKELSTHVSFMNHPLIVISSTDDEAENKVFKAFQFEDGTSQIDWLKPEYIGSMNVLRDNAATDKYGFKGNNGVIEIQLIEGVYRAFPDEIKSKFKTISTGQ